MTNGVAKGASSPLPGWTLPLDEAAAELLKNTIGSDDCVSPITLSLGDGVDGHGLYVWLTEYPEEGAILLAASPLPAPQEPAAWIVTRLRRRDDEQSGRVRYLHLSEQAAREDFDGWTDVPGASPTIAPLYAAPAPVEERARPKKPLLHCQNCGLTRITGSGPCDECGGEDFRTFDKLTNRITGEPLNAPVDEPRE